MSFCRDSSAYRVLTLGVCQTTTHSTDPHNTLQGHVGHHSALALFSAVLNVACVLMLPLRRTPSTTKYNSSYRYRHWSMVWPGSARLATGAGLKQGDVHVTNTLEASAYPSTVHASGASARSALLLRALRSGDATWTLGHHKAMYGYPCSCEFVYRLLRVFY